MNNSRTLIISGGRTDKDFALSFLSDRQYERIIAVDGGLRVLRELKLMPTDIVGDFDTVEPELLALYENNENIVIRRFNPQKDDTDSEIAVNMAIDYGSSRIDILGASGSRLDHTLGNIRLLGLIHQSGKNSFFREAYIYDRNNRVRLIEKECVIKKEEAYGTYISLLPFTQTVTGITLEGFKYPLHHHTMDIFRAPTLGISNELTASEGKITCREGVLLVIESKD
ncbi:MAG: thiamine diphosphokinase [Lachnospiraceae bacterium]|nr:thiamine diphosphokinase [Lachnospiraceae bacterium]